MMITTLVSHIREFKKSIYFDHSVCIVGGCNGDDDSATNVKNH